MADQDVTTLAAQLALTSVDGTEELSFAGKSYRLDNEHKDDVCEVVNRIRKHPESQLKVLNLEGNTLGVDAAEAIGEALKDRPEFQRALWSDMFTGRLKTEIPDALKFLTKGIMTSGAQLTELNLSDNAFGPNGMHGLEEFLKSRNVYTLKILSLNNNGLGPTGGTMLANCLMECHKSSKAAGQPLALTKFVSGRGRLEDVGATLLADAFKAMGSLEEVSMPQNGIRADGITALATGLAANPNLHTINLNDNTFTEKGAKAMAKALPLLQKLRVINFGDCLVRTKGALAIADALKDNHNELQELVLGYNELTVEAAEAIIDAINSKANLTVLDLNGNSFGEAGVESVSDMMEAAGQSQVLGSLSDDEGTEDDEDENEAEAEEAAPAQDAKPQFNGHAVEAAASTQAPRDSKLQASAMDFLQFPSAAKLQQMGPQRAEELYKTLENADAETYTEKAIGLVMKVCSVVQPQDEKTKEAACECADLIVSRTLSRSEGHTATLVTNAILVSLGLLKSEDKKFKPPHDVTGALIVLEHVVRQPFFPKSARDMLHLFLGNRGSSLQKSEACRTAAHRLLETIVKC